MRTTVTIDDEMIGQLMRESKAVSRSEAIRQAVECYLKAKRRERFKKLAGSGIAELDWQQVESLEVHEVT